MVRNVLAEICDNKRREVQRSRRLRPDPLGDVEVPTPRTADFSTFGVVAEVKKASPSAGDIASVDAARQARIYADAGARVVSVLTDADYFKGSLQDLIDVRDAVEIPVLRKDFILDPYQVDETRAAGADLVLLIAAALADADLIELADRTREHSMTPLVEVHDPDEIGAATRALAAGGLMLVNARNLKTLETDLGHWETVAAAIPAGVTAIAASGVHAPADGGRARAAGYAGVLCGEAIMRADDPAAFIAGLSGL